MSQQSNPSYEFGPFRVVPSERLLLCDGKPVALPPKAFDTLVILVENSGHALKKEDLLRMLWPDAFVEESNLNHYVSLLRKALGDSANGERFIATVAKYGFRFIADVRETNVEASSLLIRKHTRTRVVLNEEQLEKGSTARPVADLGVRKDSKRSRFVTGLALALIALAAIAGVTYIFISRHAFRNDAPTAATSAPEIRSIAVLPFKRLGAESNDDYLGLSLADSLITKLGQIRKLNVRPTSAIQKYDADARDPAQIGRELKVDVVLDGRFQESDDQIRVTVQLVNAKDRTLRWTGR